MLVRVQSCMFCGKTVHGRADKKFCNEYCRNGFHNQLNARTNRYMRQVEMSLRRNRRILGDLLQTKRSVRTTTEELRDSGFVFRYFTHLGAGEKGLQYFFCYEYGYLREPGNRVLIIRAKPTAGR